MGRMPLSLSLKLPSVLFIASGLYGFILLAKEFLNHRYLPYTSLILFLNCSGFGWIRLFFAITKSYPSADLVFDFGNDIHTNWYHPTLTFLIANRSNQLAFALIVSSLYLLLIDTEKEKYFVIGGTLGILPALEEKIFFSFLVFFVVYVASKYFQEGKTNSHKTKINFENFIVTFLGYGLIPLINMRTIENDEKLFRFSFYWHSFKENGYFFPFISTWGINLGLFPFLSLISIFFISDEKKKRFYYSTLTVFIVGNIISFAEYQPRTSVFFISTWGLMSSIFIIQMMQKFITYTTNEEIKGFILALCITIYLSMTASGIIGLKRTIFRSSVVWTEASETVAQYLKQNTHKDAVFLAPPDDYNPVSTLSGRKVLKAADMTMFASGYAWYIYSNDIKILRDNPDSNVLPFVQYALEHDHRHKETHLKSPETSTSWKVCYGFEAYQLFNRTLSN